MSTEGGDVQNGIDAAAVAAQSEARQKGWVPKEEFRGDETKWVDAAEYLTHNKRQRESGERLRADLDGVRQQNAALEARLRASQAAIDALQTDMVETKTVDFEAQELDLTGQIKAARQAGDFELEESLRDKRQEVRDEKRQLSVDKTKSTVQALPNGADPTETPEFKQFLSDNPWFKEDRVMAAASIAILSELNSSGATKDLTPSQRFALAAQKTKERFGVSERPRQSKMEGSRGGADAGGGDGTGKTYADLPQDAKDACERQAARVVGQGKRYKTTAEWQKSYTSAYFK